MKVNDDTERGEYRSYYVALHHSPEWYALPWYARACYHPLQGELGVSGIADLPGVTGVLAELTGLKETVTAKALADLVTARFVHRQGTVVWMRNALRFDPHITMRNANHRANVEKYLKTLPKLPIVAAFAAYYGLKKPDGFPDPLPEGMGEGIPEGIREGIPEQVVLREVERNNSPLLSPLFNPTPGNGTAAGAAETTGSRKKKGTQLPETWQFNAQHRALATRMQVDVELEADKFRDHAVANGRVLKDWDAGFRNWLRNAQPPKRAPVLTNGQEQAHYQRHTEGAQARERRSPEAETQERITEWLRKNGREAKRKLAVLAEEHAEALAGLTPARREEWLQRELRKWARRQLEEPKQEELL